MGVQIGGHGAGGLVARLEIRGGGEVVDEQIERLFHGSLVKRGRIHERGDVFHAGSGLGMFHERALEGRTIGKTQERYAVVDERGGPHLDAAMGVSGVQREQLARLQAVGAPVAFHKTAALAHQADDRVIVGMGREGSVEAGKAAKFQCAAEGAPYRFALLRGSCCHNEPHDSHSAHDFLHEIAGLGNGGSSALTGRGGLGSGLTATRRWLSGCGS